MKKKERELFIALSSFEDKAFDDRLITAATPHVLGQLYMNRMQGIAYDVMRKHDLLGRVNREFRNALAASHRQNEVKNHSFSQCVNDVRDLLSDCGISYAMLKGAYLCNLYPCGYRTSNDIDLLVHPRNVTSVGNILLNVGFKQGNIRNGRFISATRREIVESKMMRGETVPYIKEVNLPEMRFLEVDINFSLDYKSGDTDILTEMLAKTQMHDVGNTRVRTLRQDDFFIHLCCHLYKEATTLPWIQMKRDMTLYKYADIYMLLNHADQTYVKDIFKRAAKLEASKYCAYAILQTSELFHFNNDYAVEMAISALGEDTDFLHTVVAPNEKKMYLFTEKSIQKRFFSDDRMKMLAEVSMA